jgi:APA family basic amino acid/polyamine antiporter
MVLVALMTWILVIGIKESARFNNIIVFVKLAIIFLVIGFGFMYVNTANWHPFIPANTGHFGEFGWSGRAARRRVSSSSPTSIRRREYGGARSA